VPLIVPLTLLKHHLKRYPVPDWVHQQVCLNPYPKELMLHNRLWGQPAPYRHRGSGRTASTGTRWRDGACQTSTDLIQAAQHGLEPTSTLSLCCCRSCPRRWQYCQECLASEGRCGRLTPTVSAPKTWWRPEDKEHETTSPFGRQTGPDHHSSRTADGRHGTCHFLHKASPAGKRWSARATPTSALNSSRTLTTTSSCRRPAAWTSAKKGRGVNGRTTRRSIWTRWRNGSGSCTASRAASSWFGNQPALPIGGS
jgi:hypothetical protein